MSFLMKKNSYVYILTNKNKTVLYIGVTSNIEKRIFQHKNSQLKGFSKKYNLKCLVYYEEFGNITDAILREKTLKEKSRLKKEQLVTAFNPQWVDILLF